MTVQNREHASPSRKPGEKSVTLISDFMVTSMRVPDFGERVWLQQSPLEHRHGINRRVHGGILDVILRDSDVT